MPTVHCPTCHRPFAVADGYAGHVVACPACRHPLTVPFAPPVVVLAPPAVQEAEPDFSPPESRPQRSRGPDWTPAIALGILSLFILGASALGFWVYTSRGRDADQVKGLESGKGEPAAVSGLTPAAATTPGRMDDATVSRVKRATVLIHVNDANRGWSGSGFFVGKGKVLTNYHVINHPGDIEVVINSGTRSSDTRVARVVKRDSDRDLALLEVEGMRFPEPLTVHSSDQVRETHDVYVFGFPLGEQLGREISVSKSTVSSLRRGQLVREIQVNGGIHPGNSGGPVTDASGRVVGVAVAVIRGTTINFAVAGEEVQLFLGGMNAK